MITNSPWANFAAIGPIALLLCVSACDRSRESPVPATGAPTAAPPATSAAQDTSAIDSAIASAYRLKGDSEQDSWRKPKEVLTFLGARPGMHVLDYFSAGGYYTELLSRVAGPQGQVVAYNNASYLKSAKDQPQLRYEANRLANVSQLTAPPEELPLPPGSLDAALFVMAYHDLYWKPKDPEWGTIDPALALSRLVMALKPGGIVVVQDHIARAGGDTSTTVEAVHRIDPAVVRRDFEAAGLIFDGESTALRHVADDHTKAVFDPTVQHQTDQIIYRFRKP